jgi:two-component system chemotaxis sensor kinase CheA
MGMNEDLQRQLIHEMLIESYEGLDRFDQYLLDLEQGTADGETLNAIFRVIHTIKGTSGCLALGRIERVAHVGENLLQLMREGRLPVSRERITTLLSLSDALREMLHHLEQDGNEGTTDFGKLTSRLEELTRNESAGEGSKWGLFDDDPPAAEATPGPAATAPAATVPAAAPAPAPVAAAAPPPAPEPVAAGPAPAEAEPAAAVSRGSSVSESAIRVDVGQLDKLMNLVGELVLSRNQILQYASGSQDDGLSAASQRLNIITTELQESVMKTRMQPIGNVWSKFPRIVRDLASELGKQVALNMEGNETELDRTIIEAIKDPLTHIVRNSIDHGIEAPAVRQASGKPASGHLLLRAFHEGGQVNIEIVDDGHGIDVERVKAKAVERGLITSEKASRMPDREALNLVFAPGFSTAEKVTNVSGRGVGMDVVRTNIERIGGSVDLQTEAGRGTTLRIKIPLTLAIIPALVVTSCNERFAIPQVSLLELVRLDADQARKCIEHVSGAPVYRLRGDLLPLVYLNTVLEIGERPGEDAVVNIVVLQADGRMFGLIVDHVNDTEEIVVKPLAKQLKGLACFAGATIMGDGRIALILDVLGLAETAHAIADTREQPVLGEEDAEGSAHGSRLEDRRSMLVLGIGENRRLAIPLSAVSRLEEFEEHQVERSGSQRVVQYRGRILPLVRVEDHIAGGDSGREWPKIMPVVVSTHENRTVGLLVDRIEDIVQEQVQIERRSREEGLEGSIVLQKRVTDLLDLSALMRKVTADAEADARVNA